MALTLIKNKIFESGLSGSPKRARETDHSGFFGRIAPTKKKLIDNIDEMYQH
jgi:hypothetical protein